MSYRDDGDALRLRHDDLVRELAILEGKVAEHRRVAEELAGVRHWLQQRAERRGPLRLEKLKIAAPCQQRWEDMVGDERVRMCAGCVRPVFNLSAMTMEDAEAVLATHGVKPCVRFYRRGDGTVMTRDCPVGARRRNGLALAAGVLLASGIAAGVAYTSGGEDVREPEVGVMETGEVKPEEPAELPKESQERGVEAP
jgi:hypothetical protein